MKEVEILYESEKQYKSVVYIAVLDKNGEFRSSFYVPVDKLNETIDSMNFYKSNNYYISANTFKMSGLRDGNGRCENNLFSLDNIVLDFDIHGEADCENVNDNIDEFVWRIKRDLFQTGVLPTPNVIHKTGRGVQLWWHLVKTSVQLEFLYKQVVGYMVDIFSDFLCEYPMLKNIIVIDKAASNKPAGLYRLFGTYNTKAKRFTKSEVAHENVFDLNDLKNQIEQLEVIQQKLESKHKRQQRAESKAKRTNPTYKENLYVGLHKKRMELIDFLIDKRDNHVGLRNNMLMVYYNAAKQILPKEEAIKKVVEINQKFSEPLPKIDYIIRQKTNYKLKNNTVIDFLEITESELAEFESCHKRVVNATRDAIARENKIVKADKKSKAVNYLYEGKLTHAQIAEILGLSVSLISKMSAKIKDKPAKIKPWEAEDISRATYYRRKKLHNINVKV